MGRSSGCWRCRSLLILAALGGTAHYGGWYGGLSSSPAWATGVPPIDAETARLEEMPVRELTRLLAQARETAARVVA